MLNVISTFYKYFIDISGLTLTVCEIKLSEDKAVVVSAARWCHKLISHNQSVVVNKFPTGVLLTVLSYFLPFASHSVPKIDRK